MKDYNQLVNITQSLNFSDIAEKKIIFTPEKIKENEIAKEKMLKEEEELILEMQKKMNSGNINSPISKNLQNNFNIPHYNNDSNIKNNINNSPLFSSSELSNSNIYESHIYNINNPSSLILSQSSQISNTSIYESHIHSINIPNQQRLLQSSLISLSDMSINSSINYDGNANMNYSQITQSPVEPILRHAKSQEINIDFTMMKSPLLKSDFVNNNLPKENNFNLSSKDLLLKSYSLNYNNLFSLIKGEQEKKNQSKKKNIIELHGIKLTNYYEYTIKEREKHLNDLLIDMNYFGEIMKNEIEKDKKIITNYYSIEAAMELENTKKKYEYRNELSVLALLANALQFQGCDVLIEREYPKNKDKINELNTTVQFLASGMYNFIKFVFYFNFGEEKNYHLIIDLNQQNSLGNKLKKKLLHLFYLRENDIIITNPNISFTRNNPNYCLYSVTSIIKQSKFNELPIKKLLQILNSEPEFYNKIVDIKKKILLSGCKLNTYILDSRGNNKDGGWGFNEIRGGTPYYPPNGWVGYGLRIADRYDNGDNSWIDYNHSKGEWSVAYHGIGSGLQGNQISNSGLIMNNLIQGINQKFTNAKDLFNLNQKVGEGIIITPKPEIMEHSCGIFNFNGKHYKIGFMCRVMPKKIRCPEGQDDYWIIQGTDNEIRPYRILIKES